MTKNIIITILTILLLASGISVYAANNVSYINSFWVNQEPTNKVDINSFSTETQDCIIVVGFSKIDGDYGSNPAISCVKR